MRRRRLIVLIVYCCGCAVVDTFYLANLWLNKKPSRLSSHAQHYPLQSIPYYCKQLKSSINNDIQNFPRKRRRRKSSGKGGTKSNNSIRSNSRSILNSFEICQKEYKKKSQRGSSKLPSVSNVLDSMVDDLLNDEKNGDLPNTNLSHRILPRDASSLIRLLGRNYAHESMLRFCKRYCRDIINSSHNSQDAEEAILYAFTAAIAAISRPSISNDTSTYRSKTNLLSLLNEMEHDYTKEGRSIRPNSYTLTAVLLGIDNTDEAMDVLDMFEEKYSNDEQSDDSNIVTVQVYNVVIACCSKGSNSDGWQLALSILQRMRRYGPQPNEETYAMVLQACADCTQMKVALSLLEEIRQSGSITPTSKLYVPLLKVCAKSEDSKTADLIVTLMKDDGLQLTTEILNIYLSSLAKAGFHLRALGILQHDMIEDPLTPPDIYSFNTVLSACANANDCESAYALLENMNAGMYAFPSKEGKLIEVKPDVISYNSVISCAHPEDCLSLIQEMRLTRRYREGVVLPNSVTYVNAITQCRNVTIQEADDTDSTYEIAMYLFNQARNDHVANTYVYSAAIWMAEISRDYKTAVQLLRETPSPNNVCYDGVISVFSQLGMHREALYFYYHMNNLKLSASRKTYQRLVFAINNSRDRELASSCKRKAALLEGVLSHMPKDECTIDIGGAIFLSLIRNYGNTTDSSTSYSNARKVFDSIVGAADDKCLEALLRICSLSNDKANEAIMLLHSSDVVNSPGLVSGKALSYAVIACAKADQLDDGLTLMKIYGYIGSDSQKLEQGLLSVKAINSIIGACGRGNRADIAVEILNDMSKKYGVEPNEVSYRLAIVACNQAQHRESRQSSSDGQELQWWQCSLSLLRRMKEADIEPSLQSISSCVSACEAANMWQRAIGVLDTTQLSTSNLYCLNAAISACEKGGAWLEALQLYEDVRSMHADENAIKPNFITVNAIIIALDKANQRDLAQSIYDDAVRDNIVSPWKWRYDESDGEKKRMMVSVR